MGGSPATVMEYVLHGSLQNKLRELRAQVGTAVLNNRCDYVIHETLVRPGLYIYGLDRTLECVQHFLMLHSSESKHL